MEAYCRYEGKAKTQHKDSIDVVIADIYNKGYMAGHGSITKLRQDEIEEFYNEGKLAGIREAVEWAEQDCDCGMNLLTTHWQCPTCRRAFKEEWGI